MPNLSFHHKERAEIEGVCEQSTEEIFGLKERK
jgi:hypothetical protein